MSSVRVPPCSSSRETSRPTAADTYLAARPLEFKVVISSFARVRSQSVQLSDTTSQGAFSFPIKNPVSDSDGKQACDSANAVDRFTTAIQKADAQLSNATPH